MPTTDTSEKGFETIITDWLALHNGYETGAQYGKGEYNKDFALDEVRFFRFLEDTQPDELAKLRLESNPNERRAFLNYLSGQIVKDGVIEILRKQFRYKQAKFDLFFVLPSEGNPVSQDLFNRNIFSVTRQLQYSKENPQLAVDFVVFLNGLPIITFELKNRLTKQDVGDAVYQYQHDRDPNDIAKERLP